MNWPFDQWLAVAVQNFYLDPSEFWAMPLADWLSLITPQSSALSREHLTYLMKEYPDDGD